jgi:predicted AlkP superfamily phosphohydrolase/phosphomutase
MIIIALDGLSPEIIEPMMGAGKLPNFRRLQQEGSYSRLGTTNPSESPVAWTSFATGRNPASTVSTTSSAATLRAICRISP